MKTHVIREFQHGINLSSINSTKKPETVYVDRTIHEKVSDLATRLGKSVKANGHKIIVDGSNKPLRIELLNAEKQVFKKFKLEVEVKENGFHKKHGDIITYIALGEIKNNNYQIK